MSTGEQPDPNRPPDEPAGDADGGPVQRQRAFLETRFAVPSGRDEPADEGLGALAAARSNLASREPPAAPSALERGPGGDGLDMLNPSGFRRRVVEEYRQRGDGGGGDDLRASARATTGLVGRAPRSAPAVNWIPIGPVVARQGQAANRPGVSGRVAGIAVGPTGRTVYVASANGGVWRSDDAGLSWRSTMEGFDLDPIHPGSDSLACGAIAIDPADPDRVYVGTGEGAGAAYFGVGPIRSDDGGLSWRTERTAPGSPELAGKSFFRLALDPMNRERVVAASSVGLYRREPDGQQGFHWVSKRGGRFTSVVSAIAQGGVTFFAAEEGAAPIRSPDGDVWADAGNDFPTSLVGRIGLAVRPGDPSVVYALVERSDDHHLRGLWRLDVADGVWREVTGVPSSLFGPDRTEQGQGWYDLALAVDPIDSDIIVLGGSTRLAGNPQQWSSSLYRGAVQADGQGAGRTYTLHPTYIGSNIHADVHVIEFVPGDSQSLWVGCDGGAFFSGDAGTTFAARNLGLATLTLNKLGTHPAEDAVLFAGSQDNGTLRYTGDGVWLHSASGDGGTAVVHRVDPYRVVRTYVQGDMSRAADGGQSYQSWTDASLPEPHRKDALFYAPLVGTPASAGDGAADQLAFGGLRPWLSTNFGKTWASIPDGADTDAFPCPAGTQGFATALAFVGADRLYVGTLNRRVSDWRVLGGRVFRLDRDPVSGRWTRTRLDAAPLVNLPITAIAVDQADSGGGSIYVTLGGTGDFRHLWHFDGQSWAERSGPNPATGASLMDVQHNAVLVDPDHHDRLYAAADIGVWRSTDRGATWAKFAYGLPDAAVLDLAFHRGRRLLYAATHGRGAYEYPVDAPSASAVELYLRDTWLDRGRPPSPTDRPDPTNPGVGVDPRRGPDLKIDTPPYQLPDAPTDPLAYTDLLNDRSDRAVATAAGQAAVMNRVYVQAHNRGLASADGVRVTLLLARLSAAGKPPQLPIDYAVKVRDQIPIDTAGWRTVGTQSLDGLRAGRSAVAMLEVPSTRFTEGGADPPAQSDWCLLAFLNVADDQLDATLRDADSLALADRKVAMRQLVARLSTVPAPVAASTAPSIALLGVSRASDGALQVRLRLADTAGAPIPPDRPAAVRLASEADHAMPAAPLRYHRGWRAYWTKLPAAASTATLVVDTEVEGRTHRVTIPLPPT